MQTIINANVIYKKIINNSIAELLKKVLLSIKLIKILIKNNKVEI